MKFKCFLRLPTLPGPTVDEGRGQQPPLGNRWKPGQSGAPLQAPPASLTGPSPPSRPPTEGLLRQGREPALDCLPVEVPGTGSKGPEGASKRGVTPIL